MPKTSDKKKEIFKILEQNSRATIQQIAAQTGLTHAEVDREIQRAEKNCTILSYKTAINWDKLGEEQVWALVEVKVQPQRGVGFDSIAERIARFHQARSVYLVSGAYDLSVLVVGTNMKEVATFISEKLATLPSVQGTVTHFLLKRYKEDGLALHAKEANQRLPITF